MKEPPTTHATTRPAPGPTTSAERITSLGLMTRNARRWFALAVVVGCLFASTGPANARQIQEEDGEPSIDGYQFVCDNDGTGLSIASVLQATGEHDTFLDLFRQYDLEGFEILSDPELADKTVWAPTDAAFFKEADTLSSLSDEGIKAILGYHITPPRRTPEGPYPIITPRFLSENGEVVHQTRTGILTGSDQRLRTSTDNGVLNVEGAPILPTSWCTQTGSVFSISQVITDAPTVSVVERILYNVLFRYPYLSLPGLILALAAPIVFLRKWRSRPSSGA